MAEPARVDAVIADFQARVIADARQRLANGANRTCHHLLAPENYCDKGKHCIVVDMGEAEFPDFRETRVCPTEAEKVIRKVRQEILDRSQNVRTIAERYGVKWDIGKPLWAQLLGGMNVLVPIKVRMQGREESLARVVEMVRRGCEAPSASQPHMMLTGPCGTGKTTIQAVMYLAAAEAGIDAVFLDSIDIRDLVNDLNSRYSQTSDRAAVELERLLRRQVLFWSDVGDTQATRKEFAETISALLERFSGRLVTSTNLTPGELQRHPDIGQRAASRMLASRNEKPAIVLSFDGPDQRTAALRTAQEITAL